MRSGVVIDLGTVNTLVCTAKHGVVVDEPSVVALQRSTRQVLSVGRTALALYGRAPADVEIIKPLHDGVISDLDACTLMLTRFMHRAYRHHRPGRVGALVCVPGGATDVERNALVEATRFGSPRFQVKLVDEAVAAALGTGLDQSAGRAVLVIDVGGGTTEIGVVVGGGIVVSRSVRTAGNEMDTAIARAVRAEHGLVISERTAERLKMAVGLDEQAGVVTVTGLDATRWGWLRSADVAPKLVADALRGPVGAILGALREVIAEVPADLAGEILRAGIHLAGGGALLKGLAERVSQESCCTAHVVADPLRCVVRGLAAGLGWAGQSRLAA